MTDPQAALGLCQLRKAEQFLHSRQALQASYRSLLAGVEEVELPSVAEDVQHAWHLFILRLRLARLSISRNDFIEELRHAGVGTSVHFIPLHLQPYYAQALGCRRGDYPNAESTYERSISVPIFPSMTVENIERVAAAIRSIVARHRRQ